MYKILSVGLSKDTFLPNKNLTEILEAAISKIDLQLDTSDISDKSTVIETLKHLRTSIAAAMLQALETSRSRSSSLTSTGSLGDRISVHDKDTYLYTYPWVSRNSEAPIGRPDAIWYRGNAFRRWVEHPHRRLPEPNSALNCWEAVAVLLYMHHALSKQEIATAYTAANYEGDTPAVNQNNAQSYFYIV